MGAILRNRAAATLTLSLLLTASLAHGDETSEHHFDIGAQGLSSALNQFAQQSQQQILFAPGVVAQKLSLHLSEATCSLSLHLRCF